MVRHCGWNLLACKNKVSKAVSRDEGGRDGDGPEGYTGGGGTVWAAAAHPQCSHRACMGQGEGSMNVGGRVSGYIRPVYLETCPLHV